MPKVLFSSKAGKVKDKFSDFLTFCRFQTSYEEYDARLNFMVALARHLKLDKEKSLWIGLLYMAYYNEASGYVAYRQPGVKDRKRHPNPANPIEKHRRNFYTSSRIREHFAALYSIKALDPWFSSAKAWQPLLMLLGGVSGNGRWACYTAGELLAKMVGSSIEPTSYEIATSSGPRKGLQLLGIKPTEENAEQLRERLKREGLEVSIGVLESLLCDWNGLNKGGFYVGRNIDGQQARIRLVEEKFNLSLTTLWEVRKLVFPAWSLGELNGWEGFDKKRLKVYATTGEVLPPRGSYDPVS